MATDIKKDRNADGYKPEVVPKAFKIIVNAREEQPAHEKSNEGQELTHFEGEGRDVMSEQAVTASINGSSIVLLVSDLKSASDFYVKLGFKYEEVGGPKVKHVHVSRGNLTFILHPAADRKDVRPASSIDGGLYFDVYAYTDAVDLLVEECQANGVEIVNGPNYSKHWSEFTFRDLDGYRITCGGGLNKPWEDK